MARAAVIPQSPPKRATRGRAKGTSTKGAAGKAASKTTKAAAAKKTNASARTTVTQPPAHDDSESDDSDDEIGVIESRGRGKAAATKKKTTTSTTTTSGRGRKPAAAAPEPEVDSESENEEDELAQTEAPKKKAGRPKATTKTAAAAKPRGRPKGATAKANTDDDILKENTRNNARQTSSDDLSSSQQGPTEVFIATASAMMRGPAKTKKKVTFQELTDSEAELSEAPAPTVRRRRGTIVAKDDDGMGAKPVRKTATGATRGRKPAASKKGAAKPLSPKKATQVAKAMAYASSDGEDDELSGEKDAIKLVVHSPQKRSGLSGLGSPVRRINFSPNKPSNPVDENGEPNLPPPRSFGFGDSQFMSSPARRPPPSPFHFTLKETPKRGGLALRDTTKLSRPEATPTQESPLRKSARKANIGTPGPGSVLGRGGDGIAQPDFTPGQDSPLKTSPKKGLFGTSFSSQQPAQANSTPFKSSLLMSPAKKVSTPFRNSTTHVPSSLAKESHQEPDVETDDETLSMYDESPSRAQNFEGETQFDVNEDDAGSPERDARMTPDGSPSIQAESSQDADMTQWGHGEEYDDEEDQEASEDEADELQVNDIAENEEDVDQNVQDNMESEDELQGNEVEEPYDDQDEEESTTPRSSNEAVFESVEDQENDQDLEDAQDESDIELEEPREESPFRFSFANELEDVFTDSPLNRQPQVQDVQDEDDNNEGMSEDDELAGSHPANHENDEPTLVGETPEDDPVELGPIQPYEIEEVSDTPFVNFLLTHWAPTLPLVDVCESPMAPVDTEYRSPEPDTLEDSQEVDSSPFVPAHSEKATPVNVKKEQPSGAKRGPRFTLLAEQFSKWTANSPAKPDTKPRRRGVFSLGRPSEVPGVGSRAASTDIFANAPTLSAKPQSKPTAPPVSIHEDDNLSDDLEETVESRSPSPTRSPMAEMTHEEASNRFDIDDATRDELMEELRAEVDNEPAFESTEEKENEAAPSIPATPLKNPALPKQTFHTVSKVPLKPEGVISPLKISRKRGRSLSITSPVRTSPRLQAFDLPPRIPRVEESPPRKSARLSYGSTRKSLSRESPRKSVEPQPTPRARTSRSASPVKSPKKTPVAQHLQGAVVFVDVHTTEGEDASGIFIEVLEQMGARCIKNWSWNPRMSVSPEEAANVSGRIGITHVVFKDGGVRTLEKVRQTAGFVKCVGVAWVLDCERQGKWVDEEPYAVDSSIIPRGGAKRRKSMEPRALRNVNGTLVKNGMPGSENRRPSAYGRFRDSTPSGDDRSTPDNTRGYDAGHTEPDQKYWQTPRTPSAAALGYNLDSIGMSPATPFYLNQQSKLVQQTCPPKQTQQGLFTKSPVKGAPRDLKARLEAARRKSLAFKPSIGSPLVE